MLCPNCDGTGERDFLSGARCYECNGTGWVNEDEVDPPAGECDVCGTDMDDPFFGKWICPRCQEKEIEVTDGRE